MFDLVFLGTAAAVPSAERGLPALLVARGSSRFLIDCGEGTQRQLMRAGVGFRGVANVLEILRQGISEALYGLGKASVHDLTRDDVIVPHGFTLGQKP